MLQNSPFILTLQLLGLTNSKRPPMQTVVSSPFYAQYKYKPRLQMFSKRLIKGWLELDAKHFSTHILLQKKITRQKWAHIVSGIQFWEGLNKNYKCKQILKIHNSIVKLDLIFTYFCSQKLQQVFLATFFKSCPRYPIQPDVLSMKHFCRNSNPRV